MRALILALPVLCAGCGVIDRLHPSVTAPAPETGTLSETVPAISEVVAEPVVLTEAVAKADSPPPPAASSGTRRTVASLGDPSRAGLWLETPLVSEPGTGRVTVVASGVSAEVALIPIAGVDTGASRLSLAAMQALKVSPADLVPLDVRTGG